MMSVRFQRANLVVSDLDRALTFTATYSVCRSTS